MEVEGSGRSPDACAARSAQLTARQREVLECLVRGLRNKQTAAALGIGEKTVKMHRARMLERLGCASSADAIRLGVEAGSPALAAISTRLNCTVSLAERPRWPGDTLPERPRISATTLGVEAAAVSPIRPPRSGSRSTDLRAADHLHRAQLARAFARRWRWMTIAIRRRSPHRPRGDSCSRLRLVVA